MKDSRSELIKLLQAAAPNEGFNKTPVPGVYCIKFSKTGEFKKENWLRSVMIVAQGQKEIALGNTVAEFDDAHYIASPLDLPVTSRMKVATPKKPYIGVLLNLDLNILTEMASKIKFEDSKKVEMHSNAIFTGRADDRILEATLRLTKLFSTPDDVAVLAPFAVKEIFYHLLKGIHGKAICEFAKTGTRFNKISESIQRIRFELNREMDVEKLAEQANMSRSSFFKSFKEATAMSPIQYQNRLRLTEAQRLIIEKGQSAESAAFRVGYTSASQFSREYSRMFGKPPLKHASEFKTSI